MQVDIPGHWTLRGHRGRFSVYTVDPGDLLIGPALAVTGAWVDFCRAQLFASLPPTWTANAGRWEQQVTARGWPHYRADVTTVDVGGRTQDARSVVVFRFRDHGVAVVLCAPDADRLSRLKLAALPYLLEAQPIFDKPREAAQTKPSL